MSGCAIDHYLGENTVIEYSEGLPSDDPRSLTFSKIGMTTSKTYNMTTNTVDVTTDTSGPLNANIASGLAVDLSLSGLAKRTDSTESNLAYLVMLYTAKTLGGGCPNLWIRAVSPVFIKYFYVFIASYNETHNTKEAVSFDMALTVTATGVASNKAVQFDYVTPA